MSLLFRFLIGLFILVSHSSYGNDVLRADFEALKGKLEENQSYSTLSSARNLFAPVGVSLHKISPDDTSNYHLKIRFLVKKGSDSIGMVVPIGDQIAQVVLGGWKGKYSGINFIDGKELDTKANITHSSAGFNFGEETVFELFVRDDLVSFVINGRELSRFNPNNHKIELSDLIQGQLNQSRGASSKSGLVLWVIKGEVKIFDWEINPN